MTPQPLASPLATDLVGLAYSCSRPFYDLLSDAVSNPAALFDWVFCPYTITGLGLGGVGVIVLATGFIGLKNWSESFLVPVTWLVFTAPVLAAAMLPGSVLRQIAGVITLGVAVLFVGWWYWSGRS